MSTEIIAVLDRSYSMEPRKSSAISGFNEFLNGQQHDGDDANLTLCLFDNEIHVPVFRQPINEVQELDETSYVPRGSTSLYDAIGSLLTRFKKIIKNDTKKEVDGGIVVILTDGEENSSQRFNQNNVKALIETFEGVYDWEVIYLGANQDAFSVGHNLGIRATTAMGISKCVDYLPDARGFEGAYNTMSSSTVDYRARKRSEKM